jgi:hypothetical protein
MLIPYIAALAPLIAPAPLQQPPPVTGGVQRVPVGVPEVDCNGNGVPDRFDIAMGTSADCQGDGVPDECQLTEAYSYAWDDDEFDGAVGTNFDHIAWLINHTVVAGQEVVTEIDIAWGAMDPGTPANVGLWSDPNGDGDPADAKLLASVATTSSLEFTGTLVRIDIPDTFVGGAGTSFFVGAWGQFDQTQGWFPAAFDIDGPDQTSWWSAGDTPIDPDDISNGAGEYGLISSLCGCDGDWFVRPVVCSTGHCNESTDLNGNGRPDECDPDCDQDGLPDDYEIENGFESDCNADLVPDACQGLADCDGNGLFDICQAVTTQGLVGEYYPNVNLFGEPSSKIDSDVVFDFDVTPAFAPGFAIDDFSVRWTGAIRTFAAGTYTFGVLHDDGARLWVNGQLLIDAWKSSQATFDTASIDLAANSDYYIVLEYFEGAGNAVCELHWQPPGDVMDPMLPTELRPLYDKNLDAIPDSCQVPDCNANGVDDVEDIAFGTSGDCDGNSVPDSCEGCQDCDGNGLLDSCELVAGQGLVAQYFIADTYPSAFFLERVETRVDPTVDFNWGSGSPSPDLPENDFGARWTGTLRTPPVTGDYLIHLQVDDGVRLWLDEVLLFDEWNNAATGYTFSVPLTGDTNYLLRLEYYEAGGDARITMSWTVPGGVKEVIPQSALSPDTDLNGDGFPDLCTQDCDLNGIADIFESDVNGNCVPDSCEGGTGYWRLEEPIGPTAIDSTGNGLFGTLGTGAVRVTDVPLSTVPKTGAPNTKALKLWSGEAPGGTLSVPDIGGFLSVPSADFTLEGWVKLDQLSNTSSADERQWLFMKKPAATSDVTVEYGLLAQAGNLGGTGRELAFRYGTGSGVETIVSTFQIADNDWHYVSLAYSHKGRELRFGIDGYTESYPLEKPAISNDGALTIGAHWGGADVKNQFLRGTVDELRFTRSFLPPSALLDQAP